MSDQALLDCVRIFFQIDAVRARLPQIIMMDQRVVTKAQFARDRLQQADEFFPSVTIPQCQNDGIGKGETGLSIDVHTASTCGSWQPYICQSLPAARD